MLSLYEVLEKNINILTPKGRFSDQEKREIFATNRGWVKIRNDGRSEILVAIRNLDLKLNDIISSKKIIVNRVKKDIIIDESTLVKSSKENKHNDTAFFDYIELEEGIENKKLKKGNLIRLYLVWSDNINIKANDGLKTYIEVYNNKDIKLGNAYYKERVNEKTLMFVYKIADETINNIIKVNPLIKDGRIKDNSGNIINNPDKLFILEGVNANNGSKE